MAGQRGKVLFAANNSIIVIGSRNIINNNQVDIMRLLTKKDEQIDRLLSIIENLSKSK